MLCILSPFHNFFQSASGKTKGNRQRNKKGHFKSFSVSERLENQRKHRQNSNSSDSEETQAEEEEFEEIEAESSHKKRQEHQENMEEGKTNIIAIFLIKH